LKKAAAVSKKVLSHIDDKKNTDSSKKFTTLRMPLRHILEEKVIHATSSEGSPKEEYKQESSTLIVKEEGVRTPAPKTQASTPKKANSKKDQVNRKTP
jgi:hypothetical protein